MKRNRIRNKAPYDAGGRPPPDRSRTESCQCGELRHPAWMWTDSQGMFGTSGFHSPERLGGCCSEDDYYAECPVLQREYRNADRIRGIR